MSRISLIRIDSPENKEINLLTGEITIGRGSVLGCEDKRISRNHALLQISDDGSVGLVSLHVNPCFYKVQDLHSFAVLMKGQSKVLSNGDMFSLLPNSFQYQVVVNAESDWAPKSEVIGDNEGDLMSEINQHNQDEKVNQSQEVTSNIPGDKNSCTSLLKTKRVLPGWLANLAHAESSKNINNPNMSTAPSPVACKRACTQIAENEELGKKVKREVEEETVTNLDTTVIDEDTGTTNVPDTSNSHHQDVDDVKPGSAVKDGYEASYGATSTTVSPGPSGQGTSTNQSSNNVQTRDPCIYGATCYRKNPHHLNEFSHPGDADFGSNQNQPECPYGILCYRKSMQHRKDYKHTQPPSLIPQTNGDPLATRTKRRRAPQMDDDSEDDYDYDDPFLNDASSDDYQPTSSDTEEDEENDDDSQVLSQERKRMLKEAKKFTRKKKDES